MFRGLPLTYRKSVLADVARRPEHTLEAVVCKNPNMEVRFSLLY